MAQEFNKVVPTGIRLLPLLFAMMAVAAPASATLIDFESLGDEEEVSNQFAADGVLFENAITLRAGTSLNEIAFPPSSGLQVIAGLDLGAISAALPLGASHVSLQMTTLVDARVRFFDSLNALLGEILVAPNLGSHTLVSFDSLSPIATVSIGDQFTGSAFFLTVDDFEFITSAVPEPSMLVLGIGGLLTVAAARIRWRRS